MIDHLIDCLLNYKSNMQYKSLDFDADKPMQYKELRIDMAAIYEQDISLYLAQLHKLLCQAILKSSQRKIK